MPDDRSPSSTAIAAGSVIGECFVGDVRDGLRAFIAAGVRAQTCVTSPPYWGLRDYGTAQWDGGDDGCDHKQTVARHDGGRVNVDGFNSSARSDSDKGAMNYRDLCGKCSARRIDRQIGLEPTIAEYVATMVEVFRLVRDVLAEDGTLWLNLGDSYAANRGDGASGIGAKQATNSGANLGRLRVTDGLKPKDLCGIPWRLAFALQADGWYLRSDIIWAKPNPMPESVTDRPTKSHEYLFLFAKQERYYYDAAAIAEQVADSTVERLSQPPLDQQAGSDRVPGKTNGNMHAVIKRSGNSKRKFGDERGRPDSHIGGSIPWEGTRNKRTVWTVTTQPFSEAHFAVMPTALVEPCILAGSRPGDIVLDPFMGSGTVAKVAQSLGRRWIGCELNPDYVAMQKRRAGQFGLELACASE